MMTAHLPQVSIWREVRTAVETGSPDESAAILAEQSRLIRRSVLAMIGRARAGHIGGDFSVTDILATLYFGVLRIDPADPGAPVRDRFILSKGHCAASLYSTLAFSGYFDPAELDTFMGPHSALNGHPNRTKVPGVETNTGPLGHGLPVAVGEALGARLLGHDTRVFVVCGDGEMQEGSNWEALMSAAHYRLANLTLVIDRNRLQQGARTEDTNALAPLADKLAAFGWQVREVDGHDHAALLQAFAPADGARPVAVIANTVKGKGVSFIEDRVEWHHKVPTPDQIDLARKELA
ncbi:transketolase [Occultella glacieicola]|uniref:Transketolase n=1 Tax=Occultella glacieicola TaxID=2518684 RepID=A0ABY2E4Z3_9MICO|nr:transketolase [Occultella glacieicola]TDE95104.1 transketolase [Occultella glacieicola]